MTINIEYRHPGHIMLKISCVQFCVIDDVLNVEYIYFDKGELKTNVIKLPFGSDTDIEVNGFHMME